VAPQDLSPAEQQMLQDHRNIEELTGKLAANANELAVIWSKLCEIPHVVIKRTKCYG
jgi:hypothetical protein